MKLKPSDMERDKHDQESRLPPSSDKKGFVPLDPSKLTTQQKIALLDAVRWFRKTKQS